MIGSCCGLPTSKPDSGQVSRLKIRLRNSQSQKSINICRFYTPLKLMKRVGKLESRIMSKLSHFSPNVRKRIFIIFHIPKFPNGPLDSGHQSSPYPETSEVTYQKYRAGLDSHKRLLRQAYQAGGTRIKVYYNRHIKPVVHAATSSKSLCRSFTILQVVTGQHLFRFLLYEYGFLCGRNIGANNNNMRKNSYATAFRINESRPCGETLLILTVY